MTDHDLKEPYILTKEEEEDAIAYAVTKRKELELYKRLEKGQSQEAAALSVLEMDISGMIDRESILEYSNICKARMAWEKQQRIGEKEDAIKRRELLKATNTARDIFRLMQYVSYSEYGKRLIVNDNTKPLIIAVCYFISEDDRFETELGFSLRKGCLIRGIAGVGKTHIVRCVSENQLNPVVMHSMLEVDDIIKSEGVFIPVVPKGAKLYLDDVGTEKMVVNHYGTKVRWFKDFIEKYYLKVHDYSGLIISTNDSFDTMEKNYGFRVRSRIKDMFNVIDVKGVDLRG